MSWYTNWTGAADEASAMPDRSGVLAFATAPPPDVFLRAGADAKVAADAYEKAYRAHVASCGPSVSNDECYRGATAAGTASADIAVTNKRLVAAAATKPKPAASASTAPASAAPAPAAPAPAAEAPKPAEEPWWSSTAAKAVAVAAGAGALTLAILRRK